jgi:hypothetical protein
MQMGFFVEIRFLRTGRKTRVLGTECALSLVIYFDTSRDAILT